MDVILIGGLWLTSQVWDEVARALRELGHRPIAVRLPGADDGDRTATLSEQLGAVLAAVDAADRPVVVGHSAASTLAWLATDRRAEAVSRVVLIGGFPSGPGEAYAGFFPVQDGVMAFPGWEPFEGPDSADLSEEARAALARDAVPVPEGVATAPVEYTDPRRFSVPVTLVCPEFGPEEAKAWIAAGDVPELAEAAIDFVDLDSGHWPMITKPAELARLLGGG